MYEEEISVCQETKQKKLLKQKKKQTKKGVKQTNKQNVESIPVGSLSVPGTNRKPSERKTNFCYFVVTVILTV